MRYSSFDSSYLLVILGLALCLLAELGVKNAFKRYSEVFSRKGVTADKVAEALLQDNGCPTVTISRVSGQLTDNYNPTQDVLNLSESVYGSDSVAAIGVAAHECGHAMQKHSGYKLLALRSASVPVVNIGSKLYLPVFLLGLAFSWKPLTILGIGCFALTLFFSLITLPVEFNASSRALAALRAGNFLTEEELDGARKVLRAAALTYVASFLNVLLQLIRLILLSKRRSDD